MAVMKRPPFLANVVAVAFVLAAVALFAFRSSYDLCAPLAAAAVVGAVAAEALGAVMARRDQPASR
jgi:hypothetical protein